jgi:hypothetical protein
MAMCCASDTTPWPVRPRLCLHLQLPPTQPAACSCAANSTGQAGACAGKGGRLPWWQPCTVLAVVRPLLAPPAANGHAVHPPPERERRMLTRLASSTALSGCAELRTACCVCRTCRACSTPLPMAIWMRKVPFISRALLHAAPPAPSAQHPTLQVTTFRNRNLRMPDDADMSAELQATYEDGVSSAAAQHASSGEDTHEACLSSGHVHRGITPWEGGANCPPPSLLPT